MAGLRRIPVPSLRLAVFGLALLAVWGVLAYRLFTIQVVRADEFADSGRSQRVARQTLHPNRGAILDRNGVPLAMTVDGTSIYADPREVVDPVLTAQQVAAATGGSWEEIAAQLTADSSFVYLARQLDPAAAAAVVDLDLPGVYAVDEPKRVYPDGTVAAQVVGMVNIDGAGIEGLEYAYDDLLRGTPGEVLIEKGPSSAPVAIPFGERRIVPAVPGETLVTTLDRDLQFAAFTACEETVVRASADGCWAVALDAETGAILALAGSPAFDPVTRRAVDGSGFTNFAVRGAYEPGSTEKLITFAAALDTGAVRVSDVIGGVGDRYEVTPGACRSASDDIYGCYRDFTSHPTVDMSVREIFSESSNVGTIRVSELLGDGVLLDYMDRFGLGRPTGIDFSGEAAGAVSVDPACGSCLASAAIGYSVAVTPLQIAAAYATIANDGVWTQPYLVDSRQDENGAVAPFVPETRAVVSPETARIMRSLLAGVVEEGTGALARIPGFAVGGKTGTANKLDAATGTYTNETVASFVGMAPIEDPKVVVAVVVDDPAWELRTGGSAAAPAFGDVMEAALHRLGVTPDAVG